MLWGNHRVMQESFPGWGALLQGHGTAPALVADSGEQLDFSQLLARASDFAAALGPERRLVLLAVRNDIPSIVAWVGCLLGGHPAILLPAGQEADRIRTAFRPDAAWSAEDSQLHLAPPAGGLHPDLALLLSTSGSTGSPRLVRLSGAAVHANADAIARTLGLTPDDRAITTLPFHYSYGLSVLNSHLLAGGSLAVCDLPVTHPRFEAFLHEAQPTSLAGVPLLHRQLAMSGLAARLPASVNTLTQAGGRMPPEEVLDMIALGDARGFRFIPMYGQTEATARMAWLPPDLARTAPDCIGMPIPGGSFRLVHPSGAPIETPGTAGELVYSGPNIMMGYAETRADLARGAELSALHTGDIAERTEQGLYRILGRQSRFAKIAGHRIGFDDLEALFRAEGAPATVTGTDGLLVAHLGPDGPAATDAQAALAARISARAHVPESVLTLLAGPLPLLPSGKPDLPAILASGKAAADLRDRQLASGAHPILAGYRRAFRRQGIQPSDSFLSLGGDSLAYVGCALALEQALGEVPHGWEEMTIERLVALDSGRSGPAPGRLNVESDLIVRCVALVAIIIGHAAPSGTGWLRGGLGLLVLLAGYSFARFQQSAFEQGRFAPALTGTVERLILPYMAVMLPMLAASQVPASLPWFTLTSTFFVPDPGPLRFFWIVETLFQILLLMVALFAIPAVRRASLLNRFRLGLALLAGAVLLRAALLPLHSNDGTSIDKTPDAWLGFYVLGMLVAAASGRRRRLAVLLLGVALALWDFGFQNPRAWWLAGGLALLLWLPSIPLPRLVARPLMQITAAGYFIYLLHAPFLHLLQYQFGLRREETAMALILLPASILGGILFERLWSLALPHVRQSFERR